MANPRELYVSVYSIFIYSPKNIPSGGKIELVIQMTKQEFGEHIRKLRTEREIKQETLARDLNIRRQTISSYERGGSLPDIYTLMKIADVFDVSLDELAGREFPKSVDIKE